MVNTEQKELIITYRNDGLSYKEIAEKIGVTREYARTVCSRANRRKEIDGMIPVTDDVCKSCGKPLSRTDGKKKKQFCDDQCRNNYYNRKNMHKPYVLTCEHCGNEFVAYGNPHKRFCSRECQTLSRKERDSG